ncbi:uncharacterized protein BP01DRAFT_353306 [Aspergillus saccharolyticus JOP 1030-1]|uniref:C2 domain-containing protein n=1 Tax=Aspergillus saccharolyticus JOP 1030-1 TaxID=1450539 RepID=A0A319ABG5_9EURO|nr:hypothetical protein BP01DRAFT_353306 [Aspergillus saccharolyticus JOP 1030-1]PYH48988.1 hypothetical protein BP01DRAFT_353306 [Aspergillus saccharolyticus JOP 1030-1]
MAHAAGIFADMSVDGPPIGTLVIIVDRAKNLPNRKTMGKQNPYCAARLGKEAKKTETDLRGGQTPRWDQELRFTVHESPDYFKLKVSVFNDDKKTDLIGETWIDLKDLIIPGGSQNDHWHPLQHRGKYAGEVRLEMTYYDTRPEDEAVIERRTMGTEKVHTRKSMPSAPNVTAPSSSSSSGLSGPRQLKDVKRRPLPTDPTRARPSYPEKVPSAPVPQAPTRPAYHEPTQSAPVVANNARPIHLHGHPEWTYETPGDVQNWSSSHAHGPAPTQMKSQDYYYHSRDNQTDAVRQEVPPTGSTNPLNLQMRNEIPPYLSNPLSQQSQVTEENMRPQKHKGNYPFSSSEQYVSNLSHTGLGHYASQAPPSSSSTTSSIMPISSASNVPTASSSSDGGSAVYPSSHKSAYSSEPSTVHPYPHTYTNSSSYSQSTDYSSENYSEFSDMGPSAVTPVYYGKSISEGGRPIPQYVWARMQPRVEDEDDENNFPPPPPAHRVKLVHVKNIRPPSLVSTASGHPSVSSGLPSNYTTATTAVDSEMMSVVARNSNPLFEHQDRPSSSSGASVPPSLVAGLDPVIADAESDRVAYEREARRRSGIFEENPLRNPPRDFSPAPPYPLDTPPLDSHSSIVSHSSISSSSDRQLVPRRKSVSPRPPSMKERGVSPTPFSPDSYDALNPNASRSVITRDAAHAYETPSQAMEVAKRGDMDTTRDMGPIIGDDGREIDPSDHLPTDTWAPEPERKTKKPGVVVRFRNPAHRANPSTRPTTDGTVERGFGIRRLPAYLDGASDMERTPRSTRREHSRGREEYNSHGHTQIYSSSSPSSHGHVTHRKSVSPAPSHSPSRMYAPTNIGPPIPSKVPIAQAMNQSYPVLGGNMGMDALSRELNSIDIGSVGCSGGNRSLKKYAPKTMGYAV